jgi:hypothetical protein
VTLGPVREQRVIDPGIGVWIEEMAEFILIFLAHGQILGASTILGDEKGPDCCSNFLVNVPYVYSLPLELYIT